HLITLLCNNINGRSGPQQALTYRHAFFPGRLYFRYLDSLLITAYHRKGLFIYVYNFTRISGIYRVYRLRPPNLHLFILECCKSNRPWVKSTYMIIDFLVCPAELKFLFFPFNIAGKSGDIIILFLRLYIPIE